MEVITDKMSNMNFFDIDSICERIEKTKISYDIDEMTELQDAINTKNISISFLISTMDRYKRYVEEIGVWEVGDVSCLYIKDSIMMFLEESKKNVSKQNIIYRLQLMKYIDSEIMRLVNTYNE